MLRFVSLGKFLIVLGLCFTSFSSFAKDEKMPKLKPLPQTGSLTASSTSQFTFIVAGDNRPAKSGDPQPATPGKIFAAAQTLKPAFILWTGDTISGKSPDHAKRIKKQYDEFLGIAKTAKVPVFNAPGQS